jgi:hypothetical protein
MNGVLELERRIEATIAAFDALNATDPTRLELGATGTPRELARALRLSAWVATLAPDASPALRLAARCQHLMRWKIPRTSFPEGRAGYHQWRRHAAAFHAEQAARVMTAEGWDAATIQAVQRIVQKQGLGTNPDVQTMEDALCLAFIESDLEPFARGKSEEQLLGIVRSTWRKMSCAARSLAPPLLAPLSPTVRSLVERAIASE